LDNKNYSAKIANADPLGLVIITYELILSNTSEALKAKNSAAAKKSLLKARQFLAELIAALDLSQDVSKNLMSIYIYVNKLLIEGELKANSGKRSQMQKPIDEANSILNELLESWKKLEESDEVDKGEKIMPGALKLYAGLTYKDGELTEFVDYDEKRGYKA